MRTSFLRFFSVSLLKALSVFLCAHLWLLPQPTLAQGAADQEVAVNLAEGRVVICAAKDGIILATTDTHSEAGSRPPAIEILTAERMGVMLGAVEWVRPDSKDKPIRLDSEFHALVVAALNSGGQPKNPEGASDIESIGVSVLERLRQVAGLLHRKINLGEDEPLLRLVLAGYVQDYGPEAWTLDYHIEQDALGNDIWRTRVLRPSYYQLYPPEKGKPHTLIEVRYPPENRATTNIPELLDLLQQNDPRLANIRAGNANLAKSVDLVADGHSQKSETQSDVEFLKAALQAVNPPNTKMAMGYVDFDRGFQWVLEPPEARIPPPAEAETPSNKAPEEGERPTLRRKSGE